MSADPNADPNADARHRDRMARKKAVVDAGIKRATVERGVLLVLTGNGKGKSSSAFGMVARALGHGMKVGVVQFVKSAGGSGEETFFRRFAEVDYHVMGAGFTWETQNRDQDVATARATWTVAAEMLQNPAVDLVVLDELNIVLGLGYLTVDEILPTLRARPPHQHVVVTGRKAPQALIDAADTVTEMRDVKHAYRAGIKAQPGIEL